MSSSAPTEALASASLALARAFHHGATLWCWAPCSPADAHHLAVELVHPVIVGKRALPAFAVTVDATAAAEQLRCAARAGDVLAVVAPGDDPGAIDVVRRAPAWGLEVIWLVAGGTSPSVETGARLVHLGAGASDADVVCAYHLLWELTHVCFEHPHLLEVPADDQTSCPACGDDGDLGEVASAGGPDATVLVAGVRQPVDLSLVGPCDPGELVVVHAGVAITKLAVLSGG